MKIILVSRCAWTLYNFRSGLIRELKRRHHQVVGGGAGGDGFERQHGLTVVTARVTRTVMSERETANVRR